ncbi:hypothetical protein XENTR_v10009340 [Xenopus tropicalis]|nr:hypothetical protein XENTR_v10009340 [Xenopus tropicalis]
MNTYEYKLEDLLTVLSCIALILFSFFVHRKRQNMERNIIYLSIIYLSIYLSIYHLPLSTSWLKVSFFKMQTWIKF